MGVKERITKPLSYKQGAVLVSIVLLLLVIPALGFGKAWAFASGLRWIDYTILSSSTMLTEAFMADNPAWYPPGLQRLTVHLPTTIMLTFFIIGSFVAAVLSKEFGIRLDKSILPESIVGGILMGVGMIIITTCNIGIFLNCLPQISVSAYLAGIGLVIGTYIGAKYYEKRMGL